MNQLMTRFVQWLPLEKWRPGRAAVAGVIATAAYSLAMEADGYVISNHFNDVKWLQGWIGEIIKPVKKWAAPFAWLCHFLNGITLAEVYALFGTRLLPGPGWLRGVLFGEA